LTFNVTFRGPYLAIAHHPQASSLILLAQSTCFVSFHRQPYEHFSPVYSLLFLSSLPCPAAPTPFPTGQSSKGPLFSQFLERPSGLSNHPSFAQGRVLRRPCFNGFFCHLSEKVVFRMFPPYSSALCFYLRPSEAVFFEYHSIPLVDHKPSLWLHDGLTSFSFFHPLVSVSWWCSLFGAPFSSFTCLCISLLGRCLCSLIPV